MNTLISPREVLELAFTGSERVSPDLITESLIFSAQQKFIKPVLGALYAALEQGKYPDLLNSYIKSPLSLYVRMLLISNVAVMVSSMGVVQHEGNNFSSADDTQQAKAVSRLRSLAHSLLDRAVEYIRANPTLFSEYDHSQNINSQISIIGGVII